MVTNKIILSIIIPIFNHKNEVGVMIDSIRNNTFNEWELLAIDDGSDEETLRLISTYMDIDHRIKLIKRVRLPKGAPTCRNIGIENSSGKYILPALNQGTTKLNLANLFTVGLIPGAPFAP